MGDKVTGVMVYYYFVCNGNCGFSVIRSIWNQEMKM